MLLCNAAPAQRTAADEGRIFSDVWSRVQASIDDGATTSDEALQERRLSVIGDRELAARRRRRATRLAPAAVAIAVAGGGTAVAADFISTRTGQELTGWEVGAGGSGEVLVLEGTDRRKVLLEVTADIPFAPGYEAYRSHALELYAPQPGTADTESHAITESHLRSGIAGIAVCTWADAWVAADNAGNLETRAQATRILAQSVSWESFGTFAEDHGGPSPAESAEGDVFYRGWVRPLAEAAGAGDRQGVLDAVADSATCGHEYIPVIDADAGYEHHGLPR